MSFNSVSVTTSPPNANVHFVKVKSGWKPIVVLSECSTHFPINLEKYPVGRNPLKRSLVAIPVAAIFDACLTSKNIKHDSTIFNDDDDDDDDDGDGDAVVREEAFEALRSAWIR